MEHLSKIVLILVLSLTFSSCNQEKISNQEHLVDNISYESKIFSHKNMVFLGEEHNRFVSLYIKEYNKAGNNEDIITAFLKLKDFEMSERDARSNIEFTLNETTITSQNNFSPNHFLNKISKESINIMLNLENKIHSIDNIEKFSQYIFNEMVSVRKSTSLSIKEINIIQSYAYTLEASARLWAPEIIGGLDLYNLINKTSNHQNRRVWSWRNALAGDAFGAGAFFLGIGLTIVAPPVGAAILVNAAWTAAASSVAAGSGIFS